MYRFFFSFISLLITSVFCFSQTQSATLEYNNTRVKILNGGDFFWDLANARYEVPKNTDANTVRKNTIFSGAIWLGGKDKQGNVKLAAMTYRQRGQDFWPGPALADSNNQVRDKYDKIFIISKEEIVDHLKDPTSSSQAILDWPGNGDTTKGEPYQLAPFVDINKNGKYEPLAGDYPLIKGEQAAYCIYNDVGTHGESGGQVLNIEVHQLFYQDIFEDDEEVIDDVNFGSFTVINRGEEAIDSFIFGVFTDFDLGNYADDFIATDRARNLVFAYNGDDNDEGVLGYGLNPPTQGMIFLNHTLGSSKYYNNDPSSNDGNPFTSEHFYNYLQGRNKDGSSPGGKFAYDINEENWEDGINQPGDRRILASTEPITLEPNSPMCYDIAYVFGRAPFGGAQGGIDIMRDKALVVKQLYDDNTYKWRSPCRLGANTQEMVSIKSLKIQDKISIYPNPSNGVFYLEESQRTKEAVVLNSAGQTLLVVPKDQSVVDLSGNSPGLYFLVTEFGSMKLVKW